MAASLNRDGCRGARAILHRAAEPAFRRLPGYLRLRKAIFPQILSRRFRIAGTYCRHRWFVRYARSESLLCAMPMKHLQAKLAPALALPS